MLRNKNKGFTLIELLVVIAIIGILSAVVLASLNSARGKGSNAAIKSNLANLRAGAEMYYDDKPGSYVGVCNSNQFTTASSSIVSAGVATGLVCKDAVGSWSASAALKVAETGGAYYCVGSSGASKLVSEQVASSTSCGE
jgi:prepilin-type N-terminal cleavage/methylation domain-containing protein